MLNISAKQGVIAARAILLSPKQVEKSVSEKIGELPEPSDPAVVEQLRELEQKKGFQRAQARRAAIIISQYNHILIGLQGHVPANSLHLVAATLAASSAAGDS